MSMVGRVFASGGWKKFVSSTGDAAAKIALISTTTKDAVNCYYYTTQSYHNKKIPEDKRKFVSAMDFVNGVLNVALQLIMGSIVEQKGGKIFDKLTKNLFTEKEAINRFNTYVAGQKAKNLPVERTLELIKEGLSKHKEIAKSGFKVLSVLLVTQVFVKRVVVPFLSTPLASLAKKQLDKNSAKGAESKMTVDNNKEQSVSNHITPFGKENSKAFKGFESMLNHN